MVEMASSESAGTMNVSIFHDTLNTVGGGQRFAVDLVRTLKANRARVSMYTFDETNLGTLLQNYPDMIPPDSLDRILPFRLPKFAIYHRLWANFIIKARNKPNTITIDTYNQHPFRNTDIAYFHGASNAEAVKFPRCLYTSPYLIIRELFLNGDSNQQCVANSLFTARKIKRLYGEDSEVIYPPTDIQKYRAILLEKQPENLVLTIGRFAREKNLEIIPEIARLTRRGIRFVILGVANNNYDQQVYRNLVRISRDASNLTIISNRSPALKLDLLRKAKVYLSPARLEHFGLAVVEGIASGCYPVVIDTGGPVEIVDRLGPPFNRKFNGAEEAAGMVEDAVDSWEQFDAERISLVMAHAFGLPTFEREIMKLIKTVARRKGISA